MTGLQAVTTRTWNILSTEPWYTQVTAQVPGSSSPQNVTSDTVKFAFKPAGEAPNTPPGGSDWAAGTWTTVTQGSNTAYLASIEVGPSGSVTLAAGDYVVWIYVADSLGDPVAQVGTLTITAL